MQLPPLHETPAELRRLLTDTRVNLNGNTVFSEQTQHFQNHIRAYNNAVAFTSLKAQFDERLANTNGPYATRVSGELYHRVAPLMPPLENPNQTAKYAQVYLYDGDDMVRRQQNNGPHLRPDILRTINDILAEHNPFVELFKTAYERIQDNPDQVAGLVLTMGNPAGRDPRRYNRVTGDQLGIVVYGGETEDINPVREFLVHHRQGGLKRVPSWHSCYLPMRYPLIFHHGEQGWHSNILLGDRELDPNNPTLRAERRDLQLIDEDEIQPLARQDNDGNRIRRGRGGTVRVTALMFASYYIHYRPAVFSIIWYCGRLLCELLLDLWLCVEAERLAFQRNNQDTLRAATYSGLQDAVVAELAGDPQRIGRQVILSSSFIGSPRHMREQYHDAIALCVKYGKPDLFITFTCNPRWPEIQSALPEGFSAADNPIIVSRVFQLKLRALLDDLLKNNVLGKIVAYTYVIEFQKRGLPHAHILLILDPDDVLRTVQEIDTVVSGEIPDPEEDPELHRIIKDNMIHTCSLERCLNNDRKKCSKHFPKRFAHETFIPDDGYAVLRRRDNGRTINIRGKIYDHRNVVPYNPYLSKRYQAHINVEVCCTVRAYKYLYKYVYKGHDRANVRLERQHGEGEQEVDEIDRYRDARYVGPCEAVWRLYSFDMHNRNPAIYRLQVCWHTVRSLTLQLHLPNQQTILFRDNEPVPIERLNERTKRTMLTEFFACNKAVAEKAARGEPLEFDCRELLYHEFPEKMVWDGHEHRWRRRQKAKCLGRIYYIGPWGGEKFYLRLLLLNVRGPTSFEDLRTFGGVLHDTFREACDARGLLTSDNEWRQAMEQAQANGGTASQLRRLFVYILTNCHPADPLDLWHRNSEHLSDDCAHTLRTKYRIEAPSEEQVLSLCLALIRDLLQKLGSDLDTFQLPAPHEEFEPVLDPATRLIREQQNYNVVELRDRLARHVPTLNQEQRHAYDTLTQAVETGQGGLYFLDGFGGTGKTFVINLVLAKARSEGRVALAVASSGIAGTLLEGGTTAHSRFKIPIKIEPTSTCNVPAESEHAHLIRAAELVIWDEAVMQHRHVFEAVDRTFRDIRQDDRPFGGVIMCFSGDFRQILPVIPKGSREQIVNAALNKSELWEHVQVLRLMTNMRLQRPELSALERQQQEEFGNRLLRIGEGTDTVDNAIKWPVESIVPDNSLRTLASIVFEGITERVFGTDELASRILLAPTNDRVTEINKILLDTMPGESFTSESADEVVDGGEDIHSTEYLNTIDLPNLPPHKLIVKVGAPVILLRNLDHSAGLCNGTRLRIMRCQPRVLNCRILSGRHAGQDCFIPRIPMESADTSELGFQFKRTQFPLRLAFAITINKAQGQTLGQVGLVLDNPVFSHGQLYVALSRVTTYQNLSLIVPNTDQARAEGRLTNVVWREALLS